MGIKILIFGSVIPLMLLYGFTLVYLWGLFIAPLGLPTITIPIAIGILLTKSLLFFEYKDYDKKEPEEVVAEFIGAYVAPLLYLFIGYVVHLFM